MSLLVSARKIWPQTPVHLRQACSLWFWTRSSQITCWLPLQTLPHEFPPEMRCRAPQYQENLIQL